MGFSPTVTRTNLRLVVDFLHVHESFVGTGELKQKAWTFQVNSDGPRHERVRSVAPRLGRSKFNPPPFARFA